MKCPASIQILFSEQNLCVILIKIAQSKRHIKASVLEHKELTKTPYQVIRCRDKREDIIKIEKRKRLENTKYSNKFKHKYEKVQEVLKIIELQPNSKNILKDIELSWKIELKKMV